MAAAPEALDDDHPAAATGAWRATVRRCISGQVLVIVLSCRVDRRQGRSDQLFGAREIGFAGGTGEQSVVTDAMEPVWQNVQQEAPDELVWHECRRAKPRPAVAAVILVAEPHTALVEADQPAV